MNPVIEVSGALPIIVNGGKSISYANKRVGMSFPGITP